MLNKTDILSPWRQPESVVYSWVYYGFLFQLFICFREYFSGFEGHFFKFYSLIVFIHCFQTILHDKSFDLLEFKFIW